MLKNDSMKKTLLFCYLLANFLLLLGTYFLILMAHSLVVFTRRTGWMDDYAGVLVAILFIVLVIFCLLFAKWFTKWFFNSKSRGDRVRFLLFLGLFSALALSYWFQAETIDTQLMLRSKDGLFTAGIYPDSKRLQELKEQGVTDVVSLLDPLALPKEPFLLHEETKATQALGINLIRIPMLEGNEIDLKAKAAIEQLAPNKEKRKYYVHGRYDQSRITLFMAIIKQYNKERLMREAKKGPVTYDFERGLAIEVDASLIVAPKPNEADLTRYIFNSPNKYMQSKIQTLVSLNSEDGEVSSDHLFDQLATQGIKHLNLQLPLEPYDPQTALDIANKIRSLPKTVILYSYYMPPQSTASTAVVLSYLTNLPSLPINLILSQSMQAGKVNIIAPNVALGSTPVVSEFKDYLFNFGFRAVNYIGPCSGDNYKQDESNATAAGLKWVCSSANSYDSLVAQLRKEGPWYVYGPELVKIQDKLLLDMKDSIPDYLKIK